MRDHHWTVYSCPYGCSGSFSDSRAFRLHCKASHHEEVREHRFSTLCIISGQLQNFDSNMTCPLCLNDTILGENGYIRHVSRHLRDLATFSLPIMDDEDYGDTNIEPAKLAESPLSRSEDDVGVPIVPLTLEQPTTIRREGYSANVVDIDINQDSSRSVQRGSEAADVLPASTGESEEIIANADTGDMYRNERQYYPRRPLS